VWESTGTFCFADYLPSAFVFGEDGGVVAFWL
jgi:hypothetical protein